MVKPRICPDFSQDDSFKIKITHNPIVDLTGAVFDFVMLGAESDAAPALHVAHTAGDDADDQPLNGIVYIPVPGSATSALTSGTYFGAVKRTLNSSTVTLVRSGKNGVQKIKVYPTLIEKVV